MENLKLDVHKELKEDLETTIRKIHSRIKEIRSDSYLTGDLEALITLKENLVETLHSFALKTHQV